METIPGRTQWGDSHRVGDSPLFLPHFMPPTPMPTAPIPHLHPRAWTEARPEEGGKLRERKARGSEGQREFPQKNRGAGLPGHPKVTFTGLWVIKSVCLAELPIMAQSLERKKWQKPQVTCLNLQTAARVWHAMAAQRYIWSKVKHEVVCNRIIITDVRMGLYCSHSTLVCIYIYIQSSVSLTKPNGGGGEKHEEENIFTYPKSLSCPG